MNFKDIFATALFTRRCKWCGEVTDVRVDVCECCKDALARIEGDACLYCGWKIEDCVCNKQKHFYKYICSPLYYEGAAKKAVLRLKSKGEAEVVEMLADEMSECLKERFDGYDFEICTSVPASKKSLKERGFNQSELLAKAVSENSGIPYAPVLKKLRDTEPQHSLPRIKRSGNLLGVFSLNEACETDITDMRILLIDDICTTGATLNECAKTLLIGGAAEVFCLTAAVTRRNKKQ